MVSADRLNRSRAGLVLVLPFTTTRRDIPSHIEVEPGRSGLSTTSYAKPEDQSVSTDRLLHSLGSVSDDVLRRTQWALRLLLDLCGRAVPREGAGDQCAAPRAAPQAASSA